MVFIFVTSLCVASNLELIIFPSLINTDVILKIIRCGDGVGYFNN